MKFTLHIKTLIFLFFSTLIVQLKTEAQILLVPDQQISYEKYLEKCHLSNYKCTMSFDLETVQNKSTPLFDQLIEKLDYLSEEFQTSFTNQIIPILNSEALSFDQIEIVLKIIGQIKNSNQNKIVLKKLNLIESELNSLYDFSQKNELKELNAAFVILFKKAVDPTSFQKVKTLFLKVPLFYSRFNNLLSQQDSSKNLTLKNEPLMTGHCENAKLLPQIENLKWQAVENEDCHFFQTINPFSSTAENRFIQPKNLLVTGAVLLGAALLLNQYEVKFEF